MSAVRDPTPTLQWIRAIEAEVWMDGGWEEKSRVENREAAVEGKWQEWEEEERNEQQREATMKSSQVRLGNFFFCAAAAQANKSQNQCQSVAVSVCVCEGVQAYVCVCVKCDKIWSA